MALSIPQQTIFDSTSRFRVAVCGRRFGKTYLSMWEIARVARYPNKRIFYIAPSYRMGKQIIWEQLCEEMRSRRWVKKINESDLTITLVNGSRISIRSADNPDSMRGVSLDFVVFDEASFMDRSNWTDVIRPTLSDRLGGALFITTPQGFDWVYDMWQLGHATADWESFQYTTIQGGNVIESEILSAKRDLDLKTFKQEYEASFENAGSIIYYAFDIKSNVAAYTGDMPKIIHVGCDFNINPISAVVGVQQRDGTMNIIDEIVIKDSNTNELAQELMRRYPGYKIVAYPDPSGARRQTSSGGRSDHSILESYGIEVKAKRSHPPVKDRINAMNKMFCDASGARRLFIDPKCTETVKCVTKHQYKTGTMIPQKDGKPDYSHQNDALGYMVDYLYPIRRPAPEMRGPELFGHF
jgi:hypothetical protein